jgi:hypothetical protein
MTRFGCRAHRPPFQPPAGNERPQAGHGDLVLTPIAPVEAVIGPRLACGAATRSAGKSTSQPSKLLGAPGTHSGARPAAAGNFEAKSDVPHLSRSA